MDIHARLAALEAQQHELTAHITALREEVAEAEATAPRSRRDMFRTLGVAAAGAVGGALAFGARPAAAADGGNVVLGSGGNANNTATTQTLVTYTGTAASANGVTIDANASVTASTSVYPAALGAWAQNAAGPKNGLYGYSNVAGGYAVVAYGHSNPSLLGVDATGLLARGGVANVHLFNEGAPPASRTNAHQRGELVADASGDLWYCSVAGTPGTWQLVAGPGRAGAAAATPTLQLLPAPFRITDTRSATGPASTGAGPVATGAERVVDLTTGWQGSTSGPALPSGATGAVLTLTVVDTVGAGFLAVIADGTTYGGTSSTNWSASGQILATTVLSTVSSAGKIKVRAGGAGSANYVIDLVGYIG